MNETMFNDAQLASARTAYQLAANAAAAGNEDAAASMPKLREALDRLEGYKRDSAAVEAARDTQQKVRAAEEVNEHRQQAVAKILDNIEVSRQLAADIDDAFNFIRQHWAIYTHLIDEVKRDIAPLVDAFASHRDIYGRRKAERLNEAWRKLSSDPVLAAIQRAASMISQPNVSAAARDVAEALQYCLPIPAAHLKAAAIEEPQQPQEPVAEAGAVHTEEANGIDRDLMTRPLPVPTYAAAEPEGDDDGF